MSNKSCIGNFVDDCCASLIAIGIAANGLALRLFPRKVTPTQEISDLIRLIWKFKYLYHICNNPAVTDIQYDGYVLKLKRLERTYPDSLKIWTTSNSRGFNEFNARLAYGIDSWEELKRTLNLLKIEEEITDG